MLDHDMKMLVSGTMLCFAATVNDDGTPNLSPKSSLRVHDDTHLLFANMASPQTIENLKRNSAIEINCVDIFSRRGYRFSGKATVHSGNDPIYTNLKADIAAEHGEAIPVHDAVLIEVIDTLPVVSPAYTFIEGVTEEVLRNAYLAKYDVEQVSKPE
ncbi:MAG: pyridoxamine 5'-phosphate oxidase family protein [Pseudomonadota bacterium]|nr:pyridoxamine 5'-phosphate oxidase family protein [Pseudomonadota bacterium]